jgi:hypothetical protein
MNCQHVQRRLLAAERPEQVGADLKRHLAECPSCLALQGRIVQLESDLPHLPVPVSTRRAAFVANFVQQTPAELPASDRPTLPLVKLDRRATPVKERGHRKLAVALAVAACLAFLAVGLFAYQMAPDKPFESVSNFKVIKNVRVATAKEPRDKADAVMSVADEVGDAVRKLAKAKDGDSKEMTALAKLYRDQLLGGEFEQYVRSVPNDQFRRTTLTRLADRLQQTDSEFTNLVNSSRADAKQPLREIASAAHEAHRMVNEVLNAETN